MNLENEVKEKLKEISEVEPRIQQFIDKTDFFNFEAPASIKHHCNYEGGYVEHTLNVVVATINYKLYRDEDLGRQIFLALIHDLGKSEKYHKVYDNDFGPDKPYHWEYSYDYNDIFKTFEILARYGIPLAEEEREAIIYHHGGFTGRGIGNPKGYVDLAIFLHSADMIATHIYESKIVEDIEKGLKELDEGKGIEHEEVKKIEGDTK